MKKAVVILLGVSALALTATAQYRFGERRGWFTSAAQTAREVPSDNEEGHPPRWENPTGFESDVFTFTRIRRASVRGGGRGGGGWDTDLPDADLNFSWRVQQITSIRTDPDARIVTLVDPNLARFPFIYMSEPGSLYLEEDEIRNLRRYLTNGGFLLLDDFWGEAAWANVEYWLRKVFPDRPFAELPLTHPVYSTVFKITEKGQVPNVRTGTNSQFDGRTWEREDAREVHHRAILDDKGRIMVLAMHNTDYGDGWEREGNNHFYFKNFSLKHAYPMGINLLVYMMTH